jgi:hypothetical protein
LNKEYQWSHLIHYTVEVLRTSLCPNRSYPIFGQGRRTRVAGTTTTIERDHSNPLHHHHLQPPPQPHKTDISQIGSRQREQGRRPTDKPFATTPPHPNYISPLQSIDYHQKLAARNRCSNTLREIVFGNNGKAISSTKEKREAPQWKS